MEPKAENVVQNIGAIAETISIFYNSIARQVPKDVALALTEHFMDITISRQPVVKISPEARAVALAAAEAQRRAIAQKLRAEQEARQKQDKGTQEKPAQAEQTRENQEEKAESEPDQEPPAGL